MTASCSVRGYAVPGEQRGHLRGQFGVEQATRGHVHRHGYGQSLRQPGGGHREGLVQDVPGEWADQVALFEYRDELAGQQLAPAWVLPPDQRLDPGRRVAVQVDGRLVGQHELTGAGERLAQLGQQGQPVGTGLVAGAVVPAHRVPAALGLVHRDVRPA